MLNSVQIIGRLGKDPELKYTSSGQAVCSFTIATDESYKSKDGSKVEKTEWHSVVVWGVSAEHCGKYLGKGSLVHVEGKLETRKWEDQQGQTRYKTEIRANRVIFLDKKGDNQKQSQGNDYGFPGDASGIEDAPFNCVA